MSCIINIIIININKHGIKETSNVSFYYCFYYSFYLSFHEPRCVCFCLRLYFKYRTNILTRISLSSVVPKSEFSSNLWRHLLHFQVDNWVSYIKAFEGDENINFIILPSIMPRLARPILMAIYQTCFLLFTKRIRTTKATLQVTGRLWRRP